jgi:hypothetical protein
MFLVNRTCTTCSDIWAIPNNDMFYFLNVFVCPNCQKNKAKEKEKKSDELKFNHLKEGF